MKIMTEELSLEELQRRVRQAGLTLPNDEISRILPGVNRARKQAGELRDIVTAADEPAATFNAANRSEKS
jgi:hypothetical protein